MERLKFSVVLGATNTDVKMMDARELRALCYQTTGLVKDVRDGNEKAKRRLPAVCWAAAFSDGKRHAESAEFTGLCYMDIDHVEQPESLYDDKISGREAELGVVHAQISPSGKGLHLVFVPFNGSSIEEMQADFAARACIEDYDRQCKDVGRMLFLTDLCDTLYDALDTIN